MAGVGLPAGIKNSVFVSPLSSRIEFLLTDSVGDKVVMESDWHSRLQVTFHVFPVIKYDYTKTADGSDKKGVSIL